MARVVKPKRCSDKTPLSNLELEWIHSNERFGRVGFVESCAGPDLSVSGRTGHFKSYTSVRRYYVRSQLKHPTTGMNFVECYICGIRNKEPEAIAILTEEGWPHSLRFLVFECCRKKLHFR